MVDDGCSLAACGAENGEEFLGHVERSWVVIGFVCSWRNAIVVIQKLMLSGDMSAEGPIYLSCSEAFSLLLSDIPPEPCAHVLCIQHKFPDRAMIVPVP